MRKLYAVILFGMVMYLYYLGHAIHTPANSDYASIILEAKQIYEGNVFLSGWHLSTVSFYTTEIPFYVLGIMIFGFTHRLLYIIPALIYIMTVASALWVVYDGKRIRGALLTFCLIGLPVGVFAGMVLVGPIHMAAICFSLVCVKFLQFAERNKVFYLYFGILFCWTLIGDDLALWIIGLPAILSGLYRMYVQSERWKQEIIIPSIIILSVVASKIVLKLIALFGGFVVPGTGSPMFAELKDIARNVYSTIYGLLELFNANFFGKPIGSIQTIKLLVHFGGMILILCIFWRFLYQMIKKKEVDYTNQLMVASIVITIAAYLFSNMNMGMGTTRYLTPVVLFASILVGRRFNSFDWDQTTRWVYIACIGIYILSAISPFTLHRNLDKIDDLQAYLKSQSLTNGYAPYWLSSAVTVQSDDKVRVRPVIAPNVKIERFRWLSEDKWYDSSAKFLLFDSTNWGSINKSTAVATFGEPIKELQFQDIHILVWDKDISNYLSR